MNTIKLKLAFIILFSILGLTYIIPWGIFGVNMPFSTPYKLGLDLHGGVELDYTVDIAEAEKRNSEFNEEEAIDLLKLNLEKRIQTLSSSEATIASANYSDEKHIIVQIPTISFEGEDFSYIEEEYILENNKSPDLNTLESLIEDEKQKRNNEYLEKAKEVIGKVVTLEFKERKTEITEEDQNNRQKLIEDIYNEIKSNSPRFDILAKKYSDQEENVFYIEDSLVNENTSFFNTVVTYDKIKDAEIGYILKIDNTEMPISVALRISANLNDIGDGAKTGASIVKITGKNEIENSEGEKISQISYKTLFIDNKPSNWKVAKTSDGRSLTDAYLLSATAVLGQGFSPEIQLKFNPEGSDIFANLTERLIGEQIAIFVGGQNLTAPTVQAVIPDGLAVITGDYNMEGAQALSQDIMSGKVPAPIYLTSERSINAKLGENSLTMMIMSGAIGLMFVFIFLIYTYRISGVYAGISLIIYVILTLSVVKMFGLVLSLSSIAGLVLSLGIAIDANILIFERVKEILRKQEVVNIYEAVKTGFEESWDTIWNANITGLITAIILASFGVNLIKGFGTMLAVGIIASLVVTMYVSRAFIYSIAHKYENNLKGYLNLDK